MKKGFQPGKLVHENERPPTEPPTTVFICNRGLAPQKVKVQLEISQATLDAYKARAQGTGYTPKQVMENMLANWVDGVVAGGS